MEGYNKDICNSLQDEKNYSFFLGGEEKKWEDFFVMS